jgi:hypothetical protein
MKVLTQDKYDERVIKLGTMLKKEGVLPDLENDRYFKDQYQQKLDHHINRLLHQDGSVVEHISDNLFILETLVEMGYIVWGQEFETHFVREFEDTKTVFDMVRKYLPHCAEEYDNFRKTASLDQKIEVLQKDRNLIVTQKENKEMLDHMLFNVVQNETGRNYKKSVKEQACLVGALIRKINAREYAKRIKKKH